MYNVSFQILHILKNINQTYRLEVRNPLKCPVFLSSILEFFLYTIETILRTPRQCQSIINVKVTQTIKVFRCIMHIFYYILIWLLFLVHLCVVIYETLYNSCEGRLDHIRKFARHKSDVRCFVCYIPSH